MLDDLWIDSNGEEECRPIPLPPIIEDLSIAESKYYVFDGTLSESTLVLLILAQHRIIEYHKSEISGDASLPLETNDYEKEVLKTESLSKKLPATT